MKIICIGRNFIDHTKELNNPVPEKPVFFMKPDSAILRNNQAFYIPDFSSEIHYEVEIVLLINRLGRHIQKKFAHRYYSEIGLGIDFTARDLQKYQKEKGLPWEIAKAFDGSAPIGKFIQFAELPNPDAIQFRLDINGKTVQKGNTKDLIFDFDTLIAYISKFVTLKIGDLIFTGTPSGVGPVNIGDHLVAYLHDTPLLDFYVK